MVEIPNLWPEVDAKLRFFLDFLLTNWINIQGKMNFLQSRLAVVLGLKPQTFLKCLVVFAMLDLNCGFSMSLLLDLIQKPKVKSETNIFLSFFVFSLESTSTTSTDNFIMIQNPPQRNHGEDLKRCNTNGFTGLVMNASDVYY